MNNCVFKLHLISFNTLLITYGRSRLETFTTSSFKLANISISLDIIPKILNKYGWSVQDKNKIYYLYPF